MPFNFTDYCNSSSLNGSATCELYDIVASMQNDVNTMSDGVNTFYVIISAILAFFMQAGFAMVCAGSVREKNIRSTVLKTLLEICVGAFAFYKLGFGFAFGGDGATQKTFLGNTYFALDNYDDYSFFFFQYAFAATTATIVAGAIAERCRMAAYIGYSFFLTGFVYPVVVHSIWSKNGFLSPWYYDSSNLFEGVGTVDFAGSGVVHITGGATALVAAAILGGRRGRFLDEEGGILLEPRIFPGHSPTLRLLGSIILWVGWYGFNPGSALMSSTESNTAALCAVTTTLGATAGCVTTLFADSFIETGRTGVVSYDFAMGMNGALGGLVAITAGCAVVHPWAAVIIGAIGGVVYYAFSKLLIKFCVDDVVDAVPIHLGCGIWGMLAVGVFANGNLMNAVGYNGNRPGAVYVALGYGDPGLHLLIAQGVCVLFIIGWIVVVMGCFFFLLRTMGLLRVDPLKEDEGLDTSHHEGNANDITVESNRKE